jgi:hypothetical protein
MLGSVSLVECPPLARVWGGKPPRKGGVQILGLSVTARPVGRCKIGEPMKHLPAVIAIVAHVVTIAVGLMVILERMP